MKSFLETGVITSGQLQNAWEKPSRVMDYPSPRLDPLHYPGKRPEHSFTTTIEGDVLPIKAFSSEGGTAQFVVNTEKGVFRLDDMLNHYDVAPMKDRVPVVGFGSNASPGQLIEKFKAGNYPTIETTDDDRLIVPTLKGSIDNYVAAYSSKLGVRGYIFADLMEHLGAKTEVFVNFLSPKQLEVIKASEGAYHFCELGEVSLEGLKTPFAAYGFAGKNNVLLDEDGQPILLKDVATTADLPKMTEAEVLASVSESVAETLEHSYANLPAPVSIAAEYRDHAGNIITLSPEEYLRITAERLGTLMTYRTNFIVREDTPKTRYAYNPSEESPKEDLYGTVIINTLNSLGRVARTNLLTSIPPEKRDIQDPKTFGALYTGRTAA